MTVYFASCGPFVKIGHTRGPIWGRLEEIQFGAPDYIELLAIIDGDRRTEKEIHRALSAHRNRGEWFHFNDSVREFIDKLPKKAFPLPSDASIKYCRVIFCTTDGWFICNKGRARGPFRLRSDVQKISSAK
jgi:hypothetical protein